MAAANKRRMQYFYDNENGLFKCDTPDELRNTARFMRTPCHEANIADMLYTQIRTWRIGGPKYTHDPNCDDWFDQVIGWHCVKALQILPDMLWFAARELRMRQIDFNVDIPVCRPFLWFIILVYDFLSANHIK